MPEKTTSNYVLNLLVLGVAIVLVLVAQQNMSSLPSIRNPDGFVGQVPMVPIGGRPGGSPYPVQISPGGYPRGQPMMYPKQYYPAKVPYYNETGRPCEGGCGATGTCQGGVCSMMDQYNTVFDIPV